MLYCKQCQTAHPGKRGDAEELLLYSVMLLNATEKSYFCDPACYDAYKKENYYKPQKWEEVVENAQSKQFVRDAWRERNQAVKLQLQIN